MVDSQKKIYVYKFFSLILRWLMALRGKEVNVFFFRCLLSNHDGCAFFSEFISPLTDMCYAKLFFLADSL